VAEISIKEQIKNLVILQELDEEIYRLKRDLTEKPAGIAALSEQFEQKKGHLKELEAKMQGVLLARKTHELDLKTKEESIAKANGQLSLMKTNKEYTAKLTEIESLKADKSVSEEKILLSFDEGDALKALIDKEKASVADEEKKFSAQKKVVEEEIHAMEAKITELDGRRKENIGAVDPKNLRRYERILESRDGIAIVPMKGITCGGCYMSLGFQMINDIKKYDVLVECTMCSRILYVKEDL